MERRRRRRGFPRRDRRDRHFRRAGREPRSRAPRARPVARKIDHEEAIPAGSRLTGSPVLASEPPPRRGCARCWTGAAQTRRPSSAASLASPSSSNLRPLACVDLLPERLQLDVLRAAEPDSERQPPAAEAVQRDRLPGHLLHTPPRKRGDHRPKPQLLRRVGDRAQRNPRVGEASHGRSVRDVVPEKNPSQPRLRGLRELHQGSGIDQLVERREEDPTLRSHRLALSAGRANPSRLLAQVAPEGRSTATTGGTTNHANSEAGSIAVFIAALAALSAALVVGALSAARQRWRPRQGSRRAADQGIARTVGAHRSGVPRSRRRWRTVGPGRRAACGSAATGWICE